MKVVRATEADIPALIALRRQLAYDASRGTSTRGGFLLGCDEAGYQKRIRVGEAWVMRDPSLQGFAILVPNAAFRRSEIWARRASVHWRGLAPRDLERHRLCYFDQLAVRRGRHHNRRWGAVLAMHAIHHAMGVGKHDYMLTSTVAKPVLNLAAVPYLTRIGARRVGTLNEAYDDIGALQSDIWMLSRADFETRFSSPRGSAERLTIEACLAL
ncbi:MAG: hypothetical protein V3V08_04580 [Nannocystaceae bacterium]